MVGVPRSSGCQLCRKRRVKCDEVHPGCGNCEKYGVECPGYERGIKFVTGKHLIKQRGPRVAREGSSASTPTQLSTPSPTSTNSPISLIRAPSPDRGQFINTILESIQDSVSHTDVLRFFSWIQFERLGSKAVFDGAMCSLAMHLVGKDVSDQTMLAHSRSLYGQSLHALQVSLQHRTEWKSSETLCSAILLCVFELFAGTTASDTWLQHAKGIGVLIEQRGPAAHAHGWDAAMLLSFRGTLIMSDLFFPTGKGCFLSRPEWKPIARDGGRRLVHQQTVPEPLIHISDDFVECLAELPSIMLQTYLFREAMQMGIAVDVEKVMTLSQQAVDIHMHFSTWFEDYQTLDMMPEEVLSEEPEPLYACVLKFKDAWHGSMVNGYWASMLILQETLRLCQWPVSYEESQREYVQNILKSIEHVGKGIMGPYRMGYAMRIAYELANAESQQWIRDRLDKFSKRYAATDKASYPSPRIDQVGYS